MERQLGANEKSVGYEGVHRILSTALMR
jgi:hypothetical protein